jgi:hypothetical protein
MHQGPLADFMGKTLYLILFFAFPDFLAKGSHFVLDESMAEVNHSSPCLPQVFALAVPSSILFLLF